MGYAKSLSHLTQLYALLGLFWVSPFLGMLWSLLLLETFSSSWTKLAALGLESRCQGCEYSRVGTCARHWDLPSSDSEELSMAGNTCLSCMESPWGHPFLCPSSGCGCGCSGGSGLQGIGRGHPHRGVVREVSGTTDDIRGSVCVTN